MVITNISITPTNNYVVGFFIIVVREGTWEFVFNILPYYLCVVAITLWSRQIVHGVCDRSTRDAYSSWAHDLASGDSWNPRLPCSRLCLLYSTVRIKLIFTFFMYDTKNILKLIIEEIIDVILFFTLACQYHDREIVSCLHLFNDLRTTLK